MAIITLNDNDGQFTTTLEKTDSKNVDQLKFEVPNAFNISIADEIQYFDYDDQLIFSGFVQEIKTGTSKEITVYDKGFQLNNVIVNKVFQNLTATEILEEIITDFTDLTYVGSFTSSKVISTYKANKKKAIDVVNELVEALIANYKVDQSGNFELQREGQETSPKVITSDVATLDGSWTEDKTKLVNVVLVDGDERSIYNKTETFTGSFTELDLEDIPIDIDISVGSTQLTGFVEGSTTGDFTVNRDIKKVFFNVSQTNPVVRYTYSTPVNVRRRNKASIDLYGKSEKTFKKQYILTRDDARDFANFILNRFKDPLLSSTWNILGIEEYRDFLQYEPNDLISVTDNTRNIIGNFIIRKVVRTSDGELSIQVGSQDDDFISFQKESVIRIKQLEEKDDNSSQLTEDELVTENLRVNITSEILEIKVTGKGDAWILDDPINSQVDSTFKLDGGSDIILFP